MLRKRVADSAIVFAVVYPEQPAADECIDLGAVNFDGETAITSPTSRPLRMVADPRRGATLAHHVPARLVLAMVMAAADREVVFWPK